MRLYLQWTLATPQDWLALDLDTSGPLRRVWEKLPAKAEPVGGEIIDNLPGWGFDLNVQGVTFGGHDHYTVRPIAGGLEVTVWDDDPAEFPPGQREAQVWTFLDPAPDPAFGGAVNTRQSRVVYTEQPGKHAPDARTTIRPWSQFVIPTSLVLHGIWVTDALLNQHVAVRQPHGWREWVV